jgi:mannosyltransferase OCH1-like enzyme
MIPKIYHQVWLGNNPIPDNFKLWLSGWRNLHPDWDYKLWTDRDLTQIKDYLDKFSQYSSKSNVARLWILMNHGGVYSDLDFEWNKSINPLIKNKGFASREMPNLFCNAIMGSVKNNIWIEKQFELIPTLFNRPAPWGPKLLTKISESYPNEFTELPTEYFYPYLWNQSFKSSVNFPKSYAVHHWNKSWIK